MTTIDTYIAAAEAKYQQQVNHLTGQFSSKKERALGEIVLPVYRAVVDGVIAELAAGTFDNPSVRGIEISIDHRATIALSGVR